MNALSVDAVYGLFAQCVIVAALARLVREICGRKPPKHLWIELAAAALLMLVVPIGGVSLAGHLRGLWGDPSTVTFALLALYILRPTWLPNRPNPLVMVAVVLFVALPLYGPLLILEVPMIQRDLYSLGWDWDGIRWILGAAVVVGVVCACVGGLTNRWMNIIAVALLAYAARIMESDNLWDYLVDPGLLFTVAFLAIAGRKPASAQR